MNTQTFQLKTNGEHMYFVGLSAFNAGERQGRFLWQLIFILALGLVFSACSQTPNSPKQTPNPPATSKTPPPAPASQPAEKIWVLKKSDPRPSWLQDIPEDAEGQVYFTGQSTRHAEKRDAVDDALSDATAQIVGFAAGTQAKIFFESINRTQSAGGVSTETYTENVEKNIQTSEAFVRQIKKREQYTETYSQEQGGVALDSAYKVAVLVSFPESEVEAVQQWVDAQTREREKITSDYIQFAYEDASKGQVLNAFDWLQKARPVTENLPPGKAGALKVKIERADLSIAGQVELQFSTPTGFEIELSEVSKKLIEARILYRNPQGEIPVSSGFPLAVTLNRKPFPEPMRSKAGGNVVFSLGKIEKEGRVSLTIAPDASLQERLSADSYQTLSDKQDQLTFQAFISQEKILEKQAKARQARRKEEVVSQIENAHQNAQEGRVVGALVALNDLRAVAQQVPNEAPDLLFQIKQAEREIAERVEVLFTNVSGFRIKQAQVPNKRIGAVVFYRNSYGNSDAGNAMLSGFPVAMAINGTPFDSQRTKAAGTVIFFLKSLENEMAEQEQEQTGVTSAADGSLKRNKPGIMQRIKPGIMRLTVAPDASLEKRISPNAYEALRAKQDQMQFEVIAGRQARRTPEPVVATKQKKTPPPKYEPPVDESKSGWFAGVQWMSTSMPVKFEVSEFSNYEATLNEESDSNVLTGSGVGFKLGYFTPGFRTYLDYSTPSFILSSVDGDEGFTTVLETTSVLLLFDWLSRDRGGFYFGLGLGQVSSKWIKNFTSIPSYEQLNLKGESASGLVIPVQIGSITDWEHVSLETGLRYILRGSKTEKVEYRYVLRTEPYWPYWSYVEEIEEKHTATLDNIFSFFIGLNFY